MQIIARIISIFFIPPTFTLISFIYLALTFESNAIRKICVIAIATIFGFILLIASFIYFYKRGLVSDVDAKIKKERTIPYFFSIIIYIVGLILLLIYNVSNISIAFWFCYISNAILVILINKHFKISIHAMGAAGTLALFVILLGTEALLLLPVLIIVGWSRIKLKVHTLTEVIAGTIFGFVSVYFQLFLLLSKF